MADAGWQVAAVLGTAREGNYTGYALALALDELRRQEVGVTVLDAASLTLALPGAGDSPDGATLRDAVAAADAVILATPEYHGSFSAAMKLMIENLGFPSVLAGKPIALLGVAAGRIGAIKSLEHLRSVASHVGAIVLPGPVSVARVREAFDADGRCTDEEVERQVRGLVTRLLEYLATHVCPRMALEAMVRDG